MVFYLGTGNALWVQKYKIPFFISCRSVLKRKTQVIGNWIMDSAGFTELKKNGCYKISEQEYLECIIYTKPKLAFCQDWMCEDIILSKTKKTIEEHQELTCLNYLSLRKRSDKIMPVLQGYKVREYLNHLDMYKKYDVSINNLFGVGSICKRNSEPEEIHNILSSIKSKEPGIKLHGFGLKITSLKEERIRKHLFSADSMAWSFAGRFEHLGCKLCHKRACNHCYTYAKRFYDKVA